MAKKKISAKNREDFLSYFDDSQRKFLSFLFDYPERYKPINSFTIDFSKELFAEKFCLKEEEDIKEKYQKIVKSLKDFHFYTSDLIDGKILIYEKWNDDFTCSVVIHPMLIHYILNFFNFSRRSRSV